MARNKPSQRPNPSTIPRAPVQPSTGLRTTQTYAEIFKGPLPHPDVLRQYDQLAPGAAARIVAMAEEEASHRRDMERQQLASDVRARDAMMVMQRERNIGIFRSDKIGQLLGAIVSVAALAGSVGASIAGLKYGVTSKLYWAIPVALVSLPVAAMVKAITSRTSEIPAEKAAPPPTDARDKH